MTRARLSAVTAALLFLRCLATGHVAVTVAGATVSIPALAVAAVAAAAVAAVVAALLVYRVRAERSMPAPWQAPKAATR